MSDDTSKPADSNGQGVRKSCTEQDQNVPYPGQTATPRPMLSKGAYRANVVRMMIYFQFWLLSFLVPILLLSLRWENAVLIVSILLIGSLSLLFFFLMIGISVCQFLYRCWHLIQDGHARTTPGKAVGFIFVPFFNIYWVFVAIYGLAMDLNACAKRNRLNVPYISERIIWAKLVFVLLAGICTFAAGLSIAFMASFSSIAKYLPAWLFIIMGAFFMMAGSFFRMARTAEAIQENLWFSAGLTPPVVGRFEKCFSQIFTIIYLLALLPCGYLAKKPDICDGRFAEASWYTKYFACEYRIPDGVTCIEAYAFSKCSRLKSVTIPDGVTSIEEGAFSRCSNLESIDIPDSVIYIGYGAFAYCESLGSVTIPNSVTDIEDYAFSDCSSLKSVTIPASVKSIGAYAFSCCASLSSVTIPDSVTNIGSSPFSECRLLEKILVSPENVHFKSMEGILFTADEKTLIQAPAGKGLVDYTIPEGVTNIGIHAFVGCTSLETVMFPNGVTSIGDCAFWGCSKLRSVTISEGMTNIGAGSFYGCSSLDSVTIPDSMTNIDCGAFRGIENLTIHGKTGSEAERYAKKEGIEFQKTE
ncbi:MAG: leucine-rich repeat protein [Thermoguttaceae bacterium]|nr:leucine-rich repeat protein [Thermoguttaceae bacterium]